MVKKTSIKQAKEALTRKDLPTRTFLKKQYLSVGFTTGNLACTGTNPFGALKPGKGYLLVGKSGSGKTALLNNLAAEASINPHFKDYTIVHDDPENGNDFDITSLYSPEIAERIQPPERDKNGNPIYSKTVEQFFSSMIRLMEKGPIVAFCDSMDALMASVDKEQSKKNIHRAAKGKKEQGTMGMAKAKRNYQGYRLLLSEIERTGSILVIVCHAKDAVGKFQGYGPPKQEHTGGAALKYFASLELWTSIQGGIYAEYKEKKLEIGSYIGLEVRKNRNSGLRRRAKFPFYPQSGADDVGSCVEYLIEFGHWSMVNKVINAKEFKKKLKQEDLIKFLETPERYKRLVLIVRDVWKSVENTIKVQRVNKYKKV